MHTLPHLITDFDGVLGDTAELNYQIVTELHPNVERDTYFINHHLGNVYEQPAVPFTPQSVAAYYRRCAELLSVSHLENALPAIRTLGERYTLHIVSSNSEENIGRLLEAASVDRYFGELLGKDTHASKVEKFQRIFASEGITANETLYLTDTLGDIREAKTAGLRTVAVTFGYHSRALLETGAPDALADTWEEATAAIDGLMER